MVAVGEVAPERQAHAEYLIARLQDSHVRRHVCLRAGVRLDVGVLGPEYLLCPLDSEAFGHVNVLAAAVIPLAWIAFGVFIREYRALRFQNSTAHVVLGGYQLDLVVLAALLVLDCLPYFGIYLCKSWIVRAEFLRLPGKSGIHSRCPPRSNSLT